MRNPYDCAECDKTDCSGCGEKAYLSGYKAGMRDSNMCKALRAIVEQFESVEPLYSKDKEIIRRAREAIAEIEEE